MKLDLDQLQILSEDIDEMGGLDVGDKMAIALYRTVTSKDLKQFIDLILAESFALILLLIFILPINLIALRNFGYLTNEAAGSMRFLLGIVLLSFITFLGWNFYLWHHIGQIKSATKLIIEIEKFNEMIKVIHFLDQLESIESPKTSCDRLKNRHEVLQALQITKDTLTNALKAQKLMRTQQGLINRRYEIVANLETNLTALMALGLNSQVDDYSQLLNQALQINLSVHREMQKP